MKFVIVFLAVMLAATIAADSLFPNSMQTHYVALASVPTSTTAVYTKDVWLKSIEFIPQSSSSPTCTVTDGAGNLLYNAVSLSPNHSYRDTRDNTNPLFAKTGFTWSCSDGTVKAQVITLY